MKTTLDIPDDVMRGMKIRAATQGRKLKDVVTDALRESLAANSLQAREAQPLVIFRTPGGVPYIKCNLAADAAPPSFEDTQRLVEQSQLEEDLVHAGVPV